jgi:hypothetical protein
MRNRAKLFAASGALTVAGAILALLVLTVEYPAASGYVSCASRKGAGTIPVCNIASVASEPTFYSEMATLQQRMHDAMEINASSDIDRDFVRMMIPHHQGAIDMALLQLKYGHDERLKRLAQSIIVEQGQEIAYMRTLLDMLSGANVHKPTPR